MDIVIFGNKKGLRDELETQLRACLGRDAPIKISQVDMGRERFLLEQPPAPSAMFFIIDESSVLVYSEKASDWGEDYPLVMVATHPQYALEGIRQKVKHYILFPLERREIEEALGRAGVKP